MIIQKLWSAFSSAENKRSKSLALMLIALFTGSYSRGDEPLPSFDLEIVQKNQTGPKYQVGDRIQFGIRLPMDITHHLTSIQIKNADDKNPLDKQGLYLDPSPQVINGNLQFAVYPIKPGKLLLPELTLLKEDNTAIGRTKSIQIEVDDLEKPKQQPDLLDTIEISLPMKFLLMGLLGLSLILAAGYFAYLKWKPKKKPSPVVEIKIPPVPDYEIAARELTALYELYPYNLENLKPVAFGVSQILKNYFSSRFKIDARESTTDEMMDLLRKETLPVAEITRIKTLFIDLDVIKFTESIHHRHFTKEDFHRFREQAKSIIDQWANNNRGGLS